MSINYTLTSLSSALDSILDPEIVSLVSKIQLQPGTSGSPFIRLPDGREELSVDNIRRLVATSSNEYSQACRLAGLARAQFKLAKAAYKRKYEASLGPGKNADEREANANQKALVELEKMTLLESIVELCESIESAARVSSESSRRMLLGADQYTKAEGRVETFSDSLAPSDFQTF